MEDFWLEKQLHSWELIFDLTTAAIYPEILAIKLSATQ